MFTVSSALIWAVLTGPAEWVCHIGTLTLYIKALSCIIVTWWSGLGGIQALSARPAGFLQCFDTVGLVIWPVKIVPEMTYNVLSGTLSLYTTTTNMCRPLIESQSCLFRMSFISTSVSQMTSVSSAECSCRRQVWSVVMTLQCGSPSVADHMRICSTMPPRMGPGHLLSPVFPLVHSLPHLLLFLIFPSSHLL